MAKRVVTRVYRLRHAGSTSGWGYHMPSDGPMWFATRKAAQAYAAKMARTGGSFGRPFSTTIEPFGPSVGWASSNESRESNLRDAESALGVKFRQSVPPRRVGAKHKAGRKTSARKRVPPKRVANPSKRPVTLDAFTRAYIDAALFSSTDEDGDPLDSNYGVSDISGPTLMQMKRDAAKFQRENARDLDAGSSAQGGHDFWLTRNREGAGFWDGDWPEPAASNLTKSAHFYGSYDLYVSRGKIRH